MRKSDGAGDAAGDVGKTANTNAKNVSETDLHDKTKVDMPEANNAADSASDRAAAENVLRDMQNALEGK